MHIGCKTRLLALHDHNEEKVADDIIAILLGGESVALVSDAGTPLVSDPGFRLVRAAHDNGVIVSPIPGASAVTAALSVAGIATDRFCFEGFLPAKQAARRERLSGLVGESRTMIFYESVHRIGPFLEDLVSAFGEQRMAFVGRELTKLHEQCVQDSLSGLRERVASGDIVGKGEFVVIVAGTSDAAESPLEVDRLLLALQPHLAAKDAAKVAAEATGLKRNELYARLLQLKSGPD
jgi:16S rRNA (cytidine1402-2'-O)-methyltransferase